MGAGLFCFDLYTKSAIVFAGSSTSTLEAKVPNKNSDYPTLDLPRQLRWLGLGIILLLVFLTVTQNGPSPTWSYVDIGVGLIAFVIGAMAQDLLHQQPTNNQGEVWFLMTVTLLSTLSMIVTFVPISELLKKPVTVSDQLSAALSLAIMGLTIALYAAATTQYFKR
jgi:hypothetical protein